MAGEVASKGGHHLPRSGLGCHCQTPLCIQKPSEELTARSFHKDASLCLSGYATLTILTFTLVLKSGSAFTQDCFIDGKTEAEGNAVT